MGKYSVGRDIQPQIERDMDRREFLKKVLKYTAVAGPIAIVGVHSIYHNLDDIASALNPKKTIERDKKERERKIQADMQKLVWKPRVVQKEEGLDTYSWDFLNHHPASALEEVGIPEDPEYISEMIRLKNGLANKKLIYSRGIGTEVCIEVPVGIHEHSTE